MKKKLNLEELKIESFITSDNKSDINTIKGGAITWGALCPFQTAAGFCPSNHCTDQSDCVCQTQATGMPGCDCGGGDTRDPYDPSPNSDTCQWA